MIRYEYETLQGKVVSGLTDHVKVCYTGDKVTVLMLTERGRTIDAVGIVDHLTPPTDGFPETTKFSCDRFSINGKDL